MTTFADDAVRKRAKLARAVKELSRIQKRLAKPGGWQARRSARRSFGAQLGAVRAAMDDAYPLLPRAPRPKRCSSREGRMRCFMEMGHEGDHQFPRRERTRRITL